MDGVRRAPYRLIMAASFLALALALTALGRGGAFQTHRGAPSAGATTDLGELWTVPPVEVAAILVAAIVYALRVRGEDRVPGWRRACFAGGIIVLLVAVASPLAGISQQG
ncbi:MAG: hypothetical protein K2X91_15300, partial [Thermoleophilia bacterium]|nr:hypothetical protein [Thermoleophilia bacterium]